MSKNENYMCDFCGAYVIQLAERVLFCPSCHKVGRLPEEEVEE